MHGIQIILPGLGEPEALITTEREVRGPAPGKLLVRLDITGVSFAEVQMLRGRYPGQPAFPFVPGYDLVGTIVQIGTGVQGFAVGERVAAMTLTGAWSELVEIEARAAVGVPAAVSSSDAAAVIVNGVTARRMLIDARVRPGDTLLVHGAGGGVGTLLVQLARQLGARVIGTGRQTQRATIEALGATFIDYRSEDVPARVRALAPRGVAAVFDHVGGDSLKQSYRLL
ncbi:MAG TPA: zinc-binding dehydrogenase, partial [Polyangiaceae bacterium]|nr:zinc-binding dehydrogenase [Polyangiaceae bacterium]